MELTDQFEIVVKTAGDLAPQRTTITLAELIAILDARYEPLA